MKKYAKVNMISHSVGTANLSLIYNFSNQHYHAAVFFSECAQKIELDFYSNKVISAEQKNEYLNYTTSSVVFFIAALESSINELYYHASLGMTNSFKGISEEGRLFLSEFWPEIERLPILNKYLKALFLLKAEKIDLGAKVYQNIDNIVKLRDILIHFKPECDSDLVIQKKIQNRLKGKFKLTPFYDESYLWFPHRCLSYSCTKWVKESIIQFMQEFCKKANIPYRFY